jgi:hypothetical protein
VPSLADAMRMLREIASPIFNHWFPISGTLACLRRKRRI